VTEVATGRENNSCSGVLCSTRCIDWEYELDQAERILEPGFCRTRYEPERSPSMTSSEAAMKDDVAALIDYFEAVISR